MASEQLEQLGVDRSGGMLQQRVDIGLERQLFCGRCATNGQRTRLDGTRDQILDSGGKDFSGVHVSRSTRVLISVSHQV
ncbi:MAG: hypothetical protein C3F17_18465 [Bradyrhizobiaceae bacterium]|nr:MAG: hypothetical protein C3F17_18465 [Bradyrhizobiaceae bacterium]